MTSPRSNAASTVAFGIASLAMLALLRPFVVILLTAVVLAVVSFPVYQRLARRWGAYPAATLMTAAAILVFLTPLTIAGWLVVGEAVDAVQTVLGADGGPAGWLNERIAALPASWAAWLREPARLGTLEGLLSGLAAASLERVGPLVTGLVGAVATGAVQAGVFILVLWTLYVEGPPLAATLQRISPLPDVQMIRLYKAFQQFSSNVVIGMAATSVGQGALAALGFWVVGAPRVALLGFLSAVASQVPLVGSATIWLPVALWFMADGLWGRALIVAAWSLVLTASVDNVVKPLIYRQGLRVHPTLVLLAMMGGLQVLGPGGLLGGPLLLVVFLTLLWFRDPKNDVDAPAEI